MSICRQNFSEKFLNMRVTGVLNIHKFWSYFCGPVQIFSTGYLVLFTIFIDSGFFYLLYLITRSITR